MSVGSALKHYYAYQKWKFTLIAVGITGAILVIGGLVWWVLVGAPAWDTFLQNFVAFFTNTGGDIYLAFADLQTYFLNNWFDFVALILAFSGVGLILYGLVKPRRKRSKVTVALAGAVLAVIGSATLIGSVTARAGLIDNPYNDSPASGTTLSHYYILVQFDGFFRGGSCLDDSALEVSSVTVTEQRAVGEQTQLRWQRTSQTWTIDEDNPTAIARVYITIKYSDGSSYGETQLWQGSYAANSQFDWSLRIDCPTGKNPTQFTLKITELDYSWIFHNGYTVRYQNTWNL